MRRKYIESIVLNSMISNGVNLLRVLATNEAKIAIKLKADRPHPRDYSTHRQTPRTDNDSSLLFPALGKAEPLISTAVRQKFDFGYFQGLSHLRQ